MSASFSGNSGDNSQKGYGFIQPQNGGKDVFVHISAVEKAGLSGLNEGQVVEYEEVANRGKKSAGNPKVERSRSLHTAPTSNIKDLARSVLESAHVSPMKCGGTRRSGRRLRTAALALGPFLPLGDVRGHGFDYSVASLSTETAQRVGTLAGSTPPLVSVRRLFIGNQNDTADNDQTYSCKFRKGELFTKQEPDHHSGCNSPSNTNGSANRDR